MKHRSPKLRSHRGATEIAQFPMAIYCMFLVVLIPVLNLVTLLIAGTTAYLATNDLAAKAATQATFSQALNTMGTEAYTFQSNTLARFVKMVPQGGYTGCGSDLFVLATDIGGSGVQSSVADQSLASNIDTTKSIYEMQVVSSYSVAPLVSMASLPLLGSIPGIGQPVILSFAASRPIEHPGGMQTATNNVNSAPVPQFNRILATAPGVPAQAMPGSTWRTPNIYQKIQAAGQTVVSENVLMVQSNNPNWVLTGVSVAAGQMIWVDTQASGNWNTYPEGGAATTDANGYTSSNPNVTMTNPALPGNSLDGKVGSGGTSFMVGNEQYSLPLASAGALYMMCNDAVGDYGDNVGAQMVRVIVVN